MEKIVFIANLDNGEGMSGGTRIYLELLKRFGDVFKIYLFGSAGTIKLLKSQKINKIKFISTDNNDQANLFSTYGLFTHSIRRLVAGVKSVRENLSIVKNAEYVFSVSDFWPDILPALFLKWKNPKIKWVAAFYFFAPKPWQKNNPYATSIPRRIVGFLYWSTQLLAYQAIKRWADLVIACNETDRKIFIKDGYSPRNIIAIYGGVDLKAINDIPAPKKKSYDAIFVARFHPQKGPFVAVKVWETLVKTMPGAKLAMLGNGPEEKKVSDYIKKMKLTKNIRLFGFVDGSEKYKLIKSAKVFLHPAIYETGGMSAADGMASGLPVVAFDHEGYRYCYPKGMLRVTPIGDYKKMAKSVINILVDKKKYDIIKKQAINLMETEWDWGKRSSLVSEKIQHLG